MVMTFVVAENLAVDDALWTTVTLKAGSVESAWRRALPREPLPYVIVSLEQLSEHINLTDSNEGDVLVNRCH